MATFYSPNTPDRQPGSPEATRQKELETRIGQLTSNPGKRDIPGNLIGDFYSGKVSLEDVESQIAGSPTYDPAKGPQINYGQGNQAMTPAQLGAIAQGKSVQDAAAIGAPVNPQVQAQNQAVDQFNKSQYEQALSKMTGAAPQNINKGLGAVSGAVPSNQVTTGQQFLQTDPGIQSIIQQAQQYFTPQNQRTSLAQEYQRLLKESGVQQLDTELLNMKNVIEGTEDDIRNEITKAGGLATDSQVLALTNARNKQLIKNYNSLLDMRNSKEKYLDTLVNLTVQDRQEADRMFEQQMNFAFKIADYQQKAVDNSRNGLNKIVENLGYKGLYDSALNAGNVDIIEKTLGLQPGQLGQLALQRDIDREYKEAQIMKIHDDIKNTGGTNNPAELIAYAQQYASTGQIPTGMPKGSFGIVSQYAKEIPKNDGVIVNRVTGVADSKSGAAEQQDFARMYNIINNAKRLAEIDAERAKGAGALVGKLFGSELQTKYSALRKSIVDDMQRMQSGAALTPDETKFYAGYLPGTFGQLSISSGYPGLNVPLGASTSNKINEFTQIMENRLRERLDVNGLAMYGYSTIETPGGSFKVGEIVQNADGKTGMVLPDGSISTFE